MVQVLDVVLPILTLVIAALLTIPIYRVIRKRNRKTALAFSWFLTIFIIAGAFVANLALQYYSVSATEPFVNLSLNAPGFEAVSSAFMIDTISVFMAIAITSVGAIITLYSVLYVNSAERPTERYFAVMLLLIASLLGAVSSGDLLTLFIFWEAAAAGAAFLILFRKNIKSIHSTIKYLVMIIIASAFVVFGLSLVYGLTGSLNFWDVRNALLTLSDNRLLIVAFIFIAAGYAIESAIVPFHFWLPDAYTDAPSTSSAFLSALIDQGSYYVLLRVLVYIITPAGALDWTLMIAIMSALTMIIGNLFALVQTNIKRMIAYICVADVGYNLVAMASIIPGAASLSLGLEGNLYFFLMGGINTALAFMAIGIINRHGFKTLEDFSGVGKKIPYTSLALVIAAFSFAGVPPLAGFTAKLLVFTAAIQANMNWLAVIGVLTSVLQTAYLFRLVNYMYGKKAKDETSIKESKMLLAPIFILVAAIILLGLFPGVVFDLIEAAAHQLAFIP